MSYLAGVAVIDIQDGEQGGFTSEWQSLGLFPSKREALQAIKAYKAVNWRVMSFKILSDKNKGTLLYDALAILPVIRFATLPE